MAPPKCGMGRRDEWRKVLDRETQRWSAKSCEQLITELQESQAYEVEFGGRNYQVEAQLLEKTDDYVQVLIAVDDGSLPASLVPLSRSFIRQRGGGVFD